MKNKNKKRCKIVTVNLSIKKWDKTVKEKKNKQNTPKIHDNYSLVLAQLSCEPRNHSLNKRKIQFLKQTNKQQTCVDAVWNGTRQNNK